MELLQLIHHPEDMDRETLYELRSMVALYPYYQTARLLMLQNLYLLHDSSFDEELRRAALYITDRRVVFNMIEAAHYQLQEQYKEASAATSQADEGRKESLIDSFLDSIPAESDDHATAKRRMTPADAAVDYMSYLLYNENSNEESAAPIAPHLKGQDLIDNFLGQEQGRIVLPTFDTTPAERDASPKENEDIEEEYFTETLARIYVKQGRYQKAVDIIQRLNERMPQKNNYFADQLRFLEKLIKNENKGIKS